jgi:membrane protease YdiL (CAAX protease family)
VVVGHPVGASTQEQAQSTEPLGTSPTQAPAPGYYYEPPQAQKQSVNGFAIASMVLGIVWIYWIGSILALVFGYMARKQIDASNGREGGRGMAVAGIVLGWIGIGFIAIFIGIVMLKVVGRSTSSQFVPSNSNLQ